MYRFIVLITLNAVCVLGDRIIGGSDTNITEVPYQVLPLFGFNEKRLPFCGGSIISKKAILTAAHCVAFNLELDHYIKYGTSFRKGTDGTEVKVYNITIHEEYNSPTTENDIALMFLEEPIKFDEFAVPIALPDFGEKIEDGTMTIITGWGATKINETDPAEVLQKVSLPIANIDKCTKAYSNYSTKVKPGMICAGFDEAGLDVCGGDSGGPMAANNKLYGITSWGYDLCAAPGYPAVFVDVAYYRNWIDAKLQEHDAY